MTIRRFLAVFFAVVTFGLLSGCVAIPFAGGGCIHGQRGGGCFNATNVQPQPVIIQQQPAIIIRQGGQQGVQCPQNSYWDGRGCKLYRPYYQQGQGCFSGGRMINGTWYCMDRTSFKGLSGKGFQSGLELIEYVDPVEDDLKTVFFSKGELAS